MSKENLREYCLRVLGSAELQNHLKNLTDRGEFIAAVIESGAKFGLEISREDIELQMRENRKLWYEKWM